MDSTILGIWLSIGGIVVSGGAYFVTKTDIFGRMSKYKADKAKKRRSKINNDIQAWVIRYYFENGEGENLVTLSNGKKIPYLAKKTWYGSKLRRNKVVFNPQDIFTKQKIDNKIIEARKLIGQNIWNGKILSLSGMIESNSEIKINLKNSTYYEYLTVADTMANEAERCYGGGLIVPEFRHYHAKSIYHLQNNEPGVQLLGFSVAVVFNMGDSKYVIFQRRSDETGIAENKWAIVPTYVCEPLDFEYPAGFALHYFLLEFYEELLDKEELIQENRHLKPDWFYKDEPIKTILSLGEMFSFNIIGLGFDAITCELNVAAVAYFKDIEFCHSLHNSIKRNWEIKGMQLVKLASPEYEKLYLSDDLYHTSAFTLTCLNKYFAPSQDKVEPNKKVEASSRKRHRKAKKSGR